MLTKATVYFTGEVQWNPPAIYKSSCRMDVEWFPFDKQSCLMKFGSWTYDGNEVDLMHMKQEPENDVISTGINLTEFYVSVEWDVLDVPARKNEEFFPCCEEPYPGRIQSLSKAFLNQKCFLDRHNFQCDHAEEDSILHGQPDHPLRRHHFLDHSCLLLTFRFGRKGDVVHLHSGVVDCVLPTVG